jgi:ABC-type amino acid transport substrate-binding protein
MSFDFLKAAGALVLVILIFGFLVWLFERRRNAEQFGGNAVKGIGSGFWWSAVTMTTVGYGDKSPVTFGGRLIGFVWMFLAIIIISSFTAAIATALTLGSLKSNIQGPDDLSRVKVGTVQGSTSEEYLQNKRLSYRNYRDVSDGLSALAAGKIDAMVYDAPILRYRVNTEFKDALQVIPVSFSRQDYGIALPANSLLRETVNQLMLQKIRKAEWSDVLYRYFGKD